MSHLNAERLHRVLLAVVIAANLVVVEVGHSLAHIKLEIILC
jgi:hypothetical protein